MKILKITFVLLLSSTVFVGCRKCEVKPNADVTTHEVITYDSGDASSAAKSTKGPTAKETGKVIYVVSSGDDDRDGGDKKQRKSTGR